MAKSNMKNTDRDTHCRAAPHVNKLCAPTTNGCIMKYIFSPAVSSEATPLLLVQSAASAPVAGPTR